ncbi:MAG TPA: efflux RND transporter periplasmic adaptor subunit [Bryobacteraceae bacterium]|nr:efflux RND transporter periplasmic adaptor subunit [Bryobacteraceae bacterium]
MKLLLVMFAALALWSCQSKGTAAASKADTPAGNAQSGAASKDRSDVGIIVLDQTAQEKGHIVVEPLRARQAAATLTVPGKLSISEDQTWHVGSIAGGRVDEVSVRLGDSVRAGQILGRIHSHDVHEARAGFQQAATELERARSAGVYAKQRRDRAQRLLDLKAGSRQDLETADADLRNAHAAIEKAQSELEKERAHLAILHVPMEDPASDDGNGEEDDVPVFAPAAALIWERKATVGSVVNVGDELFTLSDTSSLWMIAAANEADLSKLHPEQPVRISVRAYPGREFAGRILKLGEQLDPDTHTLQVRILVPNQQGLLKPEMYASALVRESGVRPALFVPEEAIQEVNGVSVVFVRRAPNDFEARTVRTGQHTDEGTEILEGLTAGETVVVGGSFQLKSQLLKSTIQEN